MRPSPIACPHPPVGPSERTPAAIPVPSPALVRSSASDHTVELCPSLPPQTELDARALLPEIPVLVDNLNATKSERDRLAAELASVKENAEKLKEGLDSAEKYIASSDEKKEELAQVRAKAKIDSLAGEKERLLAELAAARSAAIETAAAHGAEISAARADIDEKEGEVLRLRAELSVMKEDSLAMAQGSGSLVSVLRNEARNEAGRVSICARRRFHCGAARQGRLLLALLPIATEPPLRLLARFHPPDFCRSTRSPSPISNTPSTSRPRPRPLRCGQNRTGKEREKRTPLPPSVCACSPRGGPSAEHRAACGEGCGFWIPFSHACFPPSTHSGC